MPSLIHTAPAPRPVLETLQALLGGQRVLRRKLESTVDAHMLLSKGLPVGSLVRLIDQMSLLDSQLILLTLNISQRTFERRKKEVLTAALPHDEGNRVWQFAEILAQASDTLGSQQAAEEWLSKPALGLGGERPIELMRTKPGADMVATLLTRMEYGVYT